MSLVDHVAHSLSDEMAADRPAAQAMSLQQFSLLGAVTAVSGRLVDFEMITPASQLDSVVAKASGLLGHLS
jgi:hypothetical protein